MKKQELEVTILLGLYLSHTCYRIENLFIILELWYIACIYFVNNYKT